MAEDNKTSKKLAARLTGLEDNVHKFTGALENFLGQIRIDDGLRLVPDNRRLTSVDSTNITLDFDPSAHNASIIDLDMAYQSESGPAEADSMDLESDENVQEDWDIGGIPSPVAGTATTPSEFQEDERMEPADDVHRRSPIPPNSGHRDADSAMAPPPPPALNIVPATPQQSQEIVGQGRKLLAPPAMSDYNTLEPGEIPTRPRARSRTPLTLQPVASSSKLLPPLTRSRSRSKTPH